MNEVELKIIKAMALGPVGEDDQGYFCLYCGAFDTKVRKDVEIEEEIYHKKDCPVILARQRLHDISIPMNIYKMTGKEHYMTTNRGEHWRNFTGYTLAVSKEDAITNYSWRSTRDVQATFIREMPIDSQAD